MEMAEQLVSLYSINLACRANSSCDKFQGPDNSYGESFQHGGLMQLMQISGQWIQVTLRKQDLSGCRIANSNNPLTKSFEARFKIENASFIWKVFMVKVVQYRTPSRAWDSPLQSNTIIISAEVCMNVQSKGNKQGSLTSVQLSLFQHKIQKTCGFQSFFRILKMQIKIKLYFSLKRGMGPQCLEIKKYCVHAKFL